MLHMSQVKKMHCPKMSRCRILALSLMDSSHATLRFRTYGTQGQETNLKRPRVEAYFAKVVFGREFPQKEMWRNVCITEPRENVSSVVVLDSKNTAAMNTGAPYFL